jgi:hypothetical protein
MADRETNLSATELAWRQGVCDERNITLDGKPARIFGACLKFAQIQLADAVLVELRKAALIIATPIHNGRRGRPELMYNLTGKAASFRNMAKNWK